jgi:hypothetical protein
MKYLCIVYHDEKMLDGMSETGNQMLVDEALDYEDVLRRRGHCVTANALEHVHTGNHRASAERQDICGGDRRARRPFGWAHSHRRDLGARRSGKLLLRAFQHERICAGGWGK